jgi:hypothetical protein
MPRAAVHFKLHASIGNHRKTVSMYGDNELLATYVRLGVLAVQRFADRTGDSFIIHQSELLAITGRERSDSARRVLQKLVDSSPVEADYHGTSVHIKFPNFAKKQGFGSRNGAVILTPPTTTPTTTPTPTILTPEPAPEAPKIEPERQEQLDRASRLCKLFWAKLVTFRPNTKKPSDSAAKLWRVEMDRMLRLDPGRTPEAVEEIVEWLFGDPHAADSRGEFWSGVIRSVPNLRKHWERAWDDMERDLRPQAPRKGSLEAAVRNIESRLEGAP